ncbi:hypothetical protein RB195_024066 [Necator americanus]|uniref:Uncharacterized protein n=1 Tax=Necator americanus TaxID=51031 RepID=A0ABR1EP21_NECAM
MELFLLAKCPGFRSIGQSKKYGSVEEVSTEPGVLGLLSYILDALVRSSSRSSPRAQLGNLGFRQASVERWEKLCQFIMTTKTILVDSHFEKPSSPPPVLGSHYGGEAINEDLKNRRAEMLAAEMGKSIRYARRDFANRKTKMTALRNPKETTIASRRGMERVIYDFYSDLFDSHVHLPVGIQGS